MNFDDYLNKVDTTDYAEKLDKLNNLMLDAETRAKVAAQEYAKQQYNDAEKLYTLKISHLEALKKAGKAITADDLAEKKKAIEQEFKLKKQNAELDIILSSKTEEQKQKALAKINKKYSDKALEEELKREEKKQQKMLQVAEKAANAAKWREEQQAATKGVQETFAKGKTLAERRESWNELSTGDKISGVIGALANYTQQLNSKIDEIASRKSSIDTNLQGSKNNRLMGSYWDQFSQDIVGIAGISPLVRQSDVVNNLSSMVNKGIAFNVEQRAFLETIKDKIATTFDAFDGNLTKLIRIQQQDTTAARLGMESALTAFLNNMYETSEYMHSVASSIRTQLYEASALMTATSATEFEYQVQKWMGSLYSVGMSDSAVNSIAGTLGKIAAGDISGISSGGTGNLLLMAANESGISISEALQSGLDASETNQLLNAAVNYLGKLYDASSDSKVLAQQIAGVYGVTASDLKAARSLMASSGTVANNSLNYGGMLGRLTSMANSMYSRTSIGELMTNASDNLKYSLAAGIAANPVLYGIYKMSNMLDDLVGGIQLPDIKVMGTGVNLRTSVADLMKVASLSGSALGAMGQMLASGSGGGLSGSGILKAIGVNNNLTTVARGDGSVGLINSGATTSESGAITGNTGGEDTLNQTMASANESKQQQKIEAEDESQETTLSTVDEDILAIKAILDNVVDGTSKFHVVMSEGGAWNGTNMGALGTGGAY